MARDTIVLGGVNPVEGKAVDVPDHNEVHEKIAHAHGDEPGSKDEPYTVDEKGAPPSSSDDIDRGSDTDREDAIIVTGADAAQHLLPLRDDFDPALTFRSIFLATCLSAFQAVMSQIYTFKPTQVNISGTFIVLIAYFAGNGWAFILPRGDKREAAWRAANGDGPLPFWIKFFKFINPRPWSIKEHAISAITATSASNAAASIFVFSAQDLFYDLPLSATTVVLSTISIGLFGYGICGIIRPICVWHVEAVYWSSLPTVKTLQGLHWQDVRDSKPLRWFWYSFGAMFVYEFFPAYIFPWLNSISIPCLAAMHATGSKGDVLGNLFGGSTNNQGLGLFSISLDWQYVSKTEPLFTKDALLTDSFQITSFQTSLPLKLQYHQAIGFFACFIAMLGIYYGNGWNAKSQPFMSTQLRTAAGSKYPTSKVFKGGILDKEAFAKFGIPKLTGSFAYAMFMANAAVRTVPDSQGKPSLTIIDWCFGCPRRPLLG